MINIDAQFDRLKELIDAAQHILDKTGETNPVAQFMETQIVPAVADLLHTIVGHRHALTESEERVVHYTSVPSLFSMFDEKRVRLYDSDNSNDPNEGQYFDKHAPFLSEHSWLATPSRMPAYLASFVISDSNDNDRPYHDHLVYWRTYGDAGRGCSIEFFSKSRGLQKVLYGEHQVELTTGLLEEFLNRVAPLVILPSPIGPRIADLVAEAFNSIRYLYKSEDYKYENECRLVVLRHQKKLGNIHFDYNRTHGGSTPVRHYCFDNRLKLKGMLNDTGTTVTVGPAAPCPETLERTMRVAIEKLGIYGAAVKRSRIDYRTS